LVAKITQAFESNKNHDSNKTFPYKIGDSVLLSTLHRRSEYLSGNGKRVAKFLPRFDGPYPVIDTHPEASTVTLDLPNQPNVFPTFHIHLIKPFIPRGWRPVDPGYGVRGGGVCESTKKIFGYVPKLRLF